MRGTVRLGEENRVTGASRLVFIQIPTLQW
jgi:hypothetical protein